MAEKSQVEPEQINIELRTRRGFLRKTTGLTGGAFAPGASAAPLPIPRIAQEARRPIEASACGMPSKYEAHVARRRTDAFRNRQNLSAYQLNLNGLVPADAATDLCLLRGFRRRNGEQR